MLTLYPATVMNLLILTAFCEIFKVILNFYFILSYITAVICSHLCVCLSLPDCKLFEEQTALRYRPSLTVFCVYSGTNNLNKSVLILK